MNTIINIIHVTNQNMLTENNFSPLPNVFELTFIYFIFLLENY